MQLFNEDCLSGMARLPDNSVDLILTDLPFNLTDCAWDKAAIDLSAMWEQFLRVTKFNAAIALFAQMPFGAELIMSQRKLFRYEWVWEKPRGVGFLNAKKMPLRCHENILIFYRKLPTYNPQFTQGKPYQKRWRVSANYGAQREHVVQSEGRRYPRDVIYTHVAADENDLLHPQQKPVQLLEYLIRTYTNESETVLDATMGSGSTGVACVNTSRNFVGFELEEKYFDIAQKRIAEAIAEREQNLFKEAVS